MSDFDGEVPIAGVHRERNECAPVHIDLDLGYAVSLTAGLGRQLGEAQAVLFQIEAVLRDAGDPDQLSRVRSIMSVHVGEAL